MGLKLIETSLETVDAGFHSLYTENDGKFTLTGVDGMKTQGDIDRLTTSLNKERTDHKETKVKLSTFGDLNAEEVHTKLDRFDELEAAASGKIDETKLNEMVESRLTSKTAPMERDLTKLQKEAIEKDELIANFEAKDRKRTIHDAVREAAMGSKIIETALDDVLMLSERVFDISEDGKVITKDNVGATPGIDPGTWLSDMQPKRPHWWPPSNGGGAGGSQSGGGGKNPFSHADWNMTAQGKIVTENPTQAANMAQSAGTTVGGMKPPAPK